MKKILFTIIAIFGLMTFSSCEKDPVLNTATVATAGDWYVQADLCDASGNVLEADTYNWHCLTYNTSANTATEMYLCDLANFGDFKVKVSVDPATMTFKTNGAVANEAYESNVTITNGKITLNGAKTPSGIPADAIEFIVLFDDGDGEYYKIHGYRYTGLASDE